MRQKWFFGSAALGALLLALGLALVLGAPPPAAAQEGLPIPGYVGSNTCAGCHRRIADQHELHGHNWVLNRVEDGQPPDYPFDQAIAPPEGYTWADVSFVVGGFSRWAMFLDLNGYFITGADANAHTQWNFPLVDARTGEVIVDGAWVGYRAGEAQVAYDCARCHTTAYNYDSNTHMDGLRGVAGAWEEEGIQCEECHGPGSLHVEDPIRVNMLIDRSSQACGACHYRGAAGVVNAADGFVDYREQFGEIQTSPHAALECIDCHNPHQSARYADEDVNPNRGMVNACTNCHFDQPSIQPHDENGVTCTECHMPPLGAGGARSADLRWGDVRSHLFQINVDPNAPQFTEDGSASMPYITVQYVCTRCHSDWSVETMADLAAGYHAARR